MEIRPSIKSEGLSGRVGGDYQGGGDLLSQLSQRVSDALDKAAGGTAASQQGQDSVDIQQVKLAIGGLSNQPLPGMLHNTVC